MPESPLTSEPHLVPMRLSTETQTTTDDHYTSPQGCNDYFELPQEFGQAYVSMSPIPDKGDGLYVTRVNEYSNDTDNPDPDLDSINRMNADKTL